MSDKSDIDTFLENSKFLLRWSLSIGAFLITALGAIIAYIVGSTISEIRTEVRDSADSYVRDSILRSQRDLNEIDDLRVRLSDSLAQYQDYKTAIDGLSAIAKMDSFADSDPQGVYDSLQALERRSDSAALTVEERAVAVQLADRAVKIAATGTTEPNLIFNTSVVCQRLNLYRQGLELAVIAEYFLPSLAHRILRAESEHLYGFDFTFDGNSIIQMEKSARDVRESTWAEIISLIEEAPGLESEQLYSRAANIATRNNSSGYQRDMIDAINRSILENLDATVSYAHAAAMRMIVLQSDLGWREEFSHHLALFAKKISQESPGASWFEHALRDVKRYVKIADAEGEFFDIMNSLGSDRVLRIYSSL